MSVSILITARNYGRYLDQAIQSALSQTVTCEVVYSDDFSTDNSVEIARKYPITVLTSDRHLGVVAARNRAVEASHGEYLVHLDGDDWLPPTFVAEHLDAIAPHPFAPFTYGPALTFGEGPRVGTLWGVHPWEETDILLGNSVNTSAMFRRQAFLDAGGWQDGVGTAWDWDLALRVARSEGQFLYRNPVPSTATLNYRMHPESVSHRGREFYAEQHAALCRKMRRRHTRLAVLCVYSGRVAGLWPEWYRRLEDSLKAMELENHPKVYVYTQNHPTVPLESVSFVTPQYIYTTDSPKNRNDVSRYLACAANTFECESEDCNMSWIVEDDILLNPTTGREMYETLLGQSNMPHAVSACYRGRHPGQHYLVAGRLSDLHHLQYQPTEDIAVDWAGTGCFMHWRGRPATPKVWRCEHEGHAAHDWAWCADLKKYGGRIVLSPEVVGHAVTETQIRWGLDRTEWRQEIRLDIGGGTRSKPGFLNVDLCDTADFQVNLSNERLPFDDDTVSEVYSSHCLEHLDDGVANVLREIVRVCKAGSRFELRVPHWLSSMAMCVGHRQTISPHQVQHWTQDFIDEWFPGKKCLKLVSTDYVPSQRFARAKELHPRWSDRDVMEFVPDACHEMVCVFTVIEKPNGETSPASA